MVSVRVFVQAHLKFSNIWPVFTKFCKDGLVVEVIRTLYCLFRFLRNDLKQDVLTSCLSVRLSVGKSIFLMSQCLSPYSYSCSIIVAIVIFFQFDFTLKALSQICKRQLLALFCLSVHPSAWTQFGSCWKDFREILYWDISLNSI